MTNVQLPVGTVTFFFTDIEGSTRLLQDVGDEAFAGFLEQHDRLIRSSIAMHGGIEIRTEGDAFFVVFTSAPDAAMAAIDAQKALQTNSWPGGLDLRVRMGLHTGNGRLGGDNYLGIDVHRAARISDAGHGGQILTSRTTADLLSSMSGGDEMSVVEIGEYRLKDVGAEQLFQLSAPGMLTEFPPPRSLGQTGSRVPEQMTTFIGRDTEIQQVSGSLAGNRVVTLTGPGGTGKTRLAMTVADSLADGYRDGAFFVPLSGISDPDLLAITILKGFGLQTNSMGILPIDHLKSYLAEKEMLVVLDNFEQLVDSADVVSSFLAVSRDVSVLVTSRVPLRIGGEVEVMVPPLPTGSSAEDGGLSESGVLFIDRVRTARPDFEPTREDLSAISQLTERLDGLPLAIELAASRIKVLTPQQMLERLDNKLLSIRGGDLPSRQRTITGTIAWSYDLLTESAQQLFVRMAVFVGGATLEEIESVCHTHDSEFEVFDDLGELVDHSLVREVGGDGPTRFAMLHVIREFAYQALNQRSEEEEFRNRHTLVYTEMVESAHGELLTSSRLKWLDRLAAEHDNIRAAMDWAVSRGDAASALTLAAGMWRYWQSRGPLPEATERVKQALSVDGDFPVLRAKTLEAAGGVAYWRGDFEAMDKPYAEAVAILREHGSSSDLAFSLYNLSFARGGVGDDAGAKAALRESLELATDTGDVFGVARANWGFYNVSWYGGDYEEAIRYSRLAIDGFESGDAPFDLGWAYFGLGDALMNTRDLVESRKAFNKGLPALLETGDLPGLILYLSAFAALEVLCDNDDRAARLAGAAQSMREKTGQSLYDTDFWSEPLKDVRDLVGSINDETVAEFQEGRLMTPAEAVHYAMNQ